MKSVPVKFPCGDITLEGEWLFPDGEPPFPGVVVAHPFPPQGGTMQNSVVTAIWQALAKDSIAALRFNFRGVGESEGSFGEGIGEREDVKAALEFAFSTEDVDSGKVGLAGYSFGAIMALPVALRDERVKGLALVSAPLSDPAWERLRQYPGPSIIIVGEEDDMTPLDYFRQQAANLPASGKYQIITGADHSLIGHEEEVARIISRFFTDIFNRQPDHRLGL